MTTPESNANTRPNAQLKTIGFIRKSNKGKALKLDLCMTELKTCKTYVGKDAKVCTTVILNIDSTRDIIVGSKNVARVVSFEDLGKGAGCPVKKTSKRFD